MQSTCFLTKGGRYYPVHRNKSIVNIYFINSKTANFSSFNPEDPFSTLFCSALRSGKLPSINCACWNPFSTGSVRIRQQESWLWERREIKVISFLFPFLARRVCAVVAPFEVCNSYSYNLCWCLITPCLFLPRPKDGKNLPLLLVPQMHHHHVLVQLSLLRPL